MARGLNETHEIFDGFLHLSWRPWRELSVIAIMLMELSWSVAWFQFFATPELSLTLGKNSIFLGLWIGIAYSLARGIHFLRLQKNARRAVMLAVFVVSVLALMKMFFYPDRLIRAGTILVSINDAFKNAELIHPVEIVVISFAAYLWNRGMSLASVWINARYAAQRFRFGAIMLLAIGVFTTSRRVEDLAIGFTLYLASSLLAIGASRASTIELLRGGRARLFDLKWFISMTFASMGIAALAWFLGRFATMEVGDLAVAALYFLGRILLILSFLIVSPLVFIILFLFPLLEKNLQISPLIQEIQKQVALVIEQVTEILDGIGSALQGFWESLPVLPFVKPLVLWLFVGLLLLLVLRTASMARRRHVFRDGPADTPERFPSQEWRMPGSGICTDRILAHYQNAFRFFSEVDVYSAQRACV